MFSFSGEQSRGVIFCGYWPYVHFLKRYGPAYCKTQNDEREQSQGDDKKKRGGTWKAPGKGTLGFCKMKENGEVSLFHYRIIMYDIYVCMQNS